MTPHQAQLSALEGQSLSPAEEAVVRSLLYSSLFDYPLTLSQLRESLILTPQTATELKGTIASLVARGLMDEADRYVFPPGCHHLVQVRQQRESRSRAFLVSHRPLLGLISRIPYVRMVALSGSVAHRNLEAGGDLDIFIVTRGATVWAVTVLVVMLAKVLGKRQTLCANFVLSDRALTLSSGDLFSANQIIGLKPISGFDCYQEFVEANPFVRRLYPNFHPGNRHDRRLAPGRFYLWLMRIIERLLLPAASVAERICRFGYRRYLRRRSRTWTSPEQVALEDLTLKLHTRSHRQTVISRFTHLMAGALD